MLRVAIATDGPYGERAYENISKKFDCKFIELEHPSSTLLEDIEIPEDTIRQLKAADLIITYVIHPDLTLELVERLHDKVSWIIVGIWKGKGFKNQLERFRNVKCPEIMCDLEENGNQVFDEFASKFGRPKVKIKYENNKITDIKVLRSSPCGSTFFVADEVIGESIEDLPVKAGLKLQHYPCRAPKMRLFTDDECKKEMTANFHKDAFEEAINQFNKKNDVNNGLRQ